MSQRAGAPYIPAFEIIPVLEEWHETLSWREISVRTGLPERTIWRIRNEDGNVEFNTLDKMLSGMGQLERWYTDFAVYYLPVSV